MEIVTVNPATGLQLAHYELMSQDRVTQIIDNMSQAQKGWASTTLDARSQLMHRLARLLREGLDGYASIITQEMGKPITQARAEIEKCALLCDYYAQHTKDYLVPQPIETEKRKSYVCYEPLGIIFAIMPWNFPFWQVLRFAVPNLMAGNVGLLKHAPNSLGAAFAIESLFEKAGFPDNVFKSLVIDVDLCPFIIHHPSVAGVTLTGSESAGMAVASEAGRALKKSVLELGGSDPYLILDDADLLLAAKQCAISRMSNAGQICIAAKRIIVVDAIREAFIEKFLEEVKQYVPGDPMLPDTNLGPMARDDLRQTLNKQVAQSIEKGAHCILGGTLSEGRGFYYPSTVLLDVRPGMPAYDEELFGPVACILYAKDEHDAIRIANDTSFGLSGAVFTQNLEKGERIARDAIQTGTCGVNALVSSDPRLPFGGVNRSGYGRELAHSGIHEFMNIKTVTVA